jgi:hypothetical protein
MFMSVHIPIKTTTIHVCPAVNNLLIRRCKNLRPSRSFPLIRRRNLSRAASCTQSTRQHTITFVSRSRRLPIVVKSSYRRISSSSGENWTAWADGRPTAVDNRVG